ncbi:MAG: Gfo/Idh/MocA family oxidoreductase, partial [Nevskiaceae bacterium]
MDALNVGVIGAGHLGQHHAGKYAACAGARLVGVADVDRARAERVAGPLGAAAFADFRELLGAVDAVSIAVPAAAHFEVAHACLSANLHVLVEKPIAVTLREADTLLALARERGRVLQVGHVERFNPVVRELARRVDNPLFIECNRLAPFKPRGTDVDVLLDLMIHDLDVISALVGAPVASIDACGVSVLSDSPDIANARLNFANGCTANITASRVSLKVERKLRVFQRDAYFSADLHQQQLTVCRKSATGEIRPEQLQLPGDALQAEIESFLDAVRRGRGAAVSGEDGRRALQLSLEIAER